MIPTRAMLSEAALSPFHRFLYAQPFIMLPDLRMISVHEFLKGGIPDDPVPTILSGRFLTANNTAVPHVNTVINHPGTVHYNMVTPHRPTPPRPRQDRPKARPRRKARNYYTSRPCPMSALLTHQATATPFHNTAKGPSPPSSSWTRSFAAYLLVKALARQS